jgi:hypothetical protein
MDEADWVTFPLRLVFCEPEQAAWACSERRAAVLVAPMHERLGPVEAVVSFEQTQIECFTGALDRLPSQTVAPTWKCR